MKTLIPDVNGMRIVCGVRSSAIWYFR